MKVLKAFTLVELLVVIAIVGLLSTIVLAVTSGVSSQGRIAKGLQFSQHLQNTLGAEAVGIWNFDEGGTSSATYDISGWGNNGTLVNSPVWRCANVNTGYTPSGQGCSLEFDGSTNYINIAGNSSLSPSSITVSSWIKMNVNAPTARNIWLTKWNGYSLEIQDTSRIPYFRLYGPGDIYSNKALTLGKWQHFVGTYSATLGGRVYLDGELVGSIPPSGNITHSIGNPLNIGRYAGGVYFDGWIDEVAIYSTVMTTVQVRSQYYAGLNRLLSEGLVSEKEYRSRLFD